MMNEMSKRKSFFGGGKKQYKSTAVEECVAEEREIVEDEYDEVDDTLAVPVAEVIIIQRMASTLGIHLVNVLLGCTCDTRWLTTNFLSVALCFKYVHYSDNAICTYSHTEECSNLAQPYGLTESL